MAGGRKEPSNVRLIETVIGTRHDAALSEALHRLAHRDLVDVLAIKSAELQRRRFRATTGHGQDIAIALPRDQTLHDGAVLALEPDYALLVRVATPRWLRIVPRDAAAAVELGYNAGNLHWRVKFEGSTLMVALEGAEDGYLARIRRMIDAGAVAIESPNSC